MEKAKGVASTGRNRITPVYIVRCTPYASESSCERQRRTAYGRRAGVASASGAEVKREGFYEAVTADKVSLRPHRRVYSGTVPKWLFDSTYPGVVHSLTFSRWRATDYDPRSIRNRLRASSRFFLSLTLSLLLLPIPLDAHLRASCLWRYRERYGDFGVLHGTVDASERRCSQLDGSVCRE